MPATRIKTLLITALAIVFTVACSPEGNPASPVLPTILPPGADNPANPGVSDDCQNSFLPVKQGASWSYYSAGGPNGDFAYTDTITETQGNEFTLTSQFPNLTLNQKWLCAPEGLIAQQLGGGTTASVSMQNMITDFRTLEVSGTSIPKEIVPGMQWEYHIAIEGSVATPGESTQSPGTFDLVMQEFGTESVTVPAGTFEAEKIQATFNAEINVDFQGSPVPYTVNGSSIVWYAPGVGYIKSIENIDFSGTSFTSVTELQSYSNLP